MNQAGRSLGEMKTPDAPLGSQRIVGSSQIMSPTQSQNVGVAAQPCVGQIAAPLQPTMQSNMTMTVGQMGPIPNNMHAHMDQTGQRMHATMQPTMGQMARPVQ